MEQIRRLLAIMARLRDPEGGCPWDLEQDFSTIAPFTIEEAYEVDDAVRRGDFADLRHELGDLLLQVVYHAQMAQEQGRFGFDDVVEAICEKLVRRHPHVFGDARIDSAAEQLHAWEAHKAAERAAGGGARALEGVPLGLPALLRAGKLQQRAARTGFDWPGEEHPSVRLAASLGELAGDGGDGGDPERRVRVLGDLLFAAVALARRLGVEPEEALRASSARFERRFRAVERELAARGQEPGSASVQDWLALWRRAEKKEGR